MVRGDIESVPSVLHKQPARVKDTAKPPRMLPPCLLNDMGEQVPKGHSQVSGVSTFSFKCARGEKGRVVILSERTRSNADHLIFHNTTRPNGTW